MKELLCLVLGLSFIQSLDLCGANLPLYCNTIQNRTTNEVNNIWRPFKTVKSSQDVVELYYNGSKFKANSKDNLKIIVPTEKDELTLVLKETKLYLNPENNLSNTKHYRGHIQNQPHSKVSLNISSGTISGIIKTNEDELVIQPKSAERNLVELFKSNTKRKTDWECKTDLLNQKVESLPKLSQSNLKSNYLDTLLLYLEADYHLFQLNNNSLAETYEYLNGVMNEVGAIYQNEGIIILIEELKVWTTPDPYNQYSSLQALRDFKSNVNDNFSAHLAHLISANPLSLGGIAYINGICNRSAAYGFSNIHGSYDQYSSYTWDVHVIAHELGHNLGSPHTHDCVWGPEGNESIDACLDNPCTDEIPSEGGTIMSYCHNDPVGIDLTLGFGSQPGNLIRYYLNNCVTARNSHCHQAEVIDQSGTYHVSAPENGYGATYTSADHATWFVLYAIGDGYISGGSCNQDVDTRLILHQGKCADLAQIKIVDDSCFSGGGLYYAAAFDSLRIEKDQVYYFEWDNRWSDQGFEFAFEVEYDEEQDHCNNGIQDYGETGIDCGGVSCIPCCTDNVSLGSTINKSFTINTNDTLYIHSAFQAPAVIELCSGTSISFEAGFEIAQGAHLSANIEKCKS